MIFTRRQLLQGVAATTLVVAVPAVSLADYHNMTARERYEESRREAQSWERSNPSRRDEKSIRFNEDGSASYLPTNRGVSGFYFNEDGRAIYHDNPIHSLGY